MRLAHMLIVMYDLRHSYANICFITGLRYTTILFWADDTIMSFDIFFEFVETMYRV